MEPRDLPSVDALATELASDPDVGTLPASLITAVVRSVIDETRSTLAAHGDADDPTSAARERLTSIAAARPTAVINATGVLLHTNLGRAVVPAASLELAGDIATSASNVEIDVRTGRRSSRTDYLAALLPVVTGADAGFAVNNNAGALLLALAAVAGQGGKVAVSRGELIEIGGSFRLPSLMKASGARLVEVGTTNRTRPDDYRAVAHDVDAILKVHPSNYRIDGFAEEASYAELAAIAAEYSIPFVADIGSGLMDETAPWMGSADRSWLASEPGVTQTVASGADLVLFSGDKLLGGPQAGIVVGKREAVAQAARHPIARAVRLDGQAIASLVSILEMYADSRVLEIPFWRMATTTLDELEERANRVADGLGPTITVVGSEALPGAGSVPGRSIESIAIRIAGDPDTVWEHLAAQDRPVIAVRRDGATFVDLRSVDPGSDETIRSALAGLVS